MTILDTRAQLAADDSLVGRELCEVWTDEVDRWLRELHTIAVEGSDPRGVALVAVGGYGRGELSLQSDIDVLLLHAGRPDIGELADRHWYPIWDARLKLGHAVRTVKEALALGADDLDTATGLLQARHLAGDRALTDELIRKAELQWRKRAKRWLAALAARARERHGRAGEVAFLLEPDLKEGRGGLRDVHALRWAAGRRRRSSGTTTRPASTPPTTRCSPCGSSCTGAPAAPATACCCRSRTRSPAPSATRHADVLMRDRGHTRPARSPGRATTPGPASRARWPAPWPAPGATGALGAGLVLRDGEVHMSDDARPRPPTRPCRCGRPPPPPATAPARSAHARPPGRPRRRRPTAPGRTTVRRRARRPAARRPAGGGAARGARPAGRVGALPARVADGAVEAPAQRLPPLHGRPAPVGGRGAGRGPGRPGPPARPAGARRPAPRHRQGLPAATTRNRRALLATIGPRIGLDAARGRRAGRLCGHHLLLPDVATRRDLDDATATISQWRPGPAVATAPVGLRIAATTENDSVKPR